MQAIILLLVYLISIFPATLFHHHQGSSIAYSSASACEKTIYFGIETENCGHQKHISTPSEKCSICDHHATVFCTFDFFSLCFFKQPPVCKYQNHYKSLIASYSVLCINKGPPVV
jgi:hypothetical protein